jgi:sorting nexin-29
MEDMKIPYKLLRLVKMTMKNTTARVKVTNKLSNSFTFNAGAKQGDGLSTTLFILVLHYGVQKIDQRGTIFPKLSQICAYANNIVIVAKTQEKLIEVYLDLEDETSKLGMEINEKKTKYMVTSRYEYRRNVGDLRIGNKTFEAVQSFQYLGNITSSTSARLIMQLDNYSIVASYQEAASCRYITHWYVQLSPMVQNHGHSPRKRKQH